jgi:hypothetical protein
VQIEAYLGRFHTNGRAHVVQQFGDVLCRVSVPLDAASKRGGPRGLLAALETTMLTGDRAHRALQVAQLDR